MKVVSFPSVSSRTFPLSNPSGKAARQIAALKQENASLRRQVAHLERVGSEQQVTMGQLQSQLETMSEQITLMKKALFGRRRERYIPSPDQKLLFASEPSKEDEDEEEPPLESDQDGMKSEQPDRRRRRQSRKRFEFLNACPSSDLSIRFHLKNWPALVVVANGW